MPAGMKLALPPPRDGQPFEDLCRDLWAELWRDPNAQKHGRSGQKQHGVDVFGQPAGRFARPPQGTALAPALDEPLFQPGEGEVAP